MILLLVIKESLITIVSRKKKFIYIFHPSVFLLGGRERERYQPLKLINFNSLKKKTRNK